MNGYETLIVEAGAASAGLLTPGTVQRALALGAGLKSHDIGTMRPVARGRVEVEITSVRAWSLVTPAALPVGDSVLNLRRDTDLAPLAATALQATWSGEAPSPGALAAALSGATQGQLGAEALGAGFATATSVTVEVPAHWVHTLAALGSVDVGGVSVALAAHGAG